MSAFRPCSLIVLAALSLSACNKAEESTAAAAATPAAPTAAAEPSEAPAVAASGDSIGIAACDDYLDKYEACISEKVPAEVRATLKTSLDQTRDAWRSTMSSGAAKDQLEAACKTMYDSAKASMSAYGCTNF